jgi:hypothetical protein
MSHSRPIPAASVSPYPLHPAPISSEERSGSSEVSAKETNIAVSTSGRTIGITAGALAIGSAAIAAALIFYNRTTKATPVVTRRGQSSRTVPKRAQPK